MQISIATQLPAVIGGTFTDSPLNAYANSDSLATCPEIGSAESASTQTTMPIRISR